MVLFAAAAVDTIHNQLGQRAELVSKNQIALAFFGEKRKWIRTMQRDDGLEIVAEYRAQHDGQRHIAHVLGQVDFLLLLRARRPFLEQLQIGAADMRHHGRDDVAVKRRLDHSALAAPQFAFAYHDAIAEQDTDTLDADALGVVLVVVHEHAPDVIGVAEHVNVGLSDRRVDAKYIAVLRKCATEPRQYVLGKADIERLGGARWRCGGAGRGLRMF